LVVLAVGSQYLQVISNMARVEAAESEVKTAQALYQQATDLQKAGVSARIDPLRSQVELQSRQQQLIVAQNDFDKSKLTLIRIIGLPVAQPITLTDRVPFEPLAAIDFDSALQRSYTRRQDYLSAKAQVEAAQLAKRQQPRNAFRQLASMQIMAILARRRAIHTALLPFRALCDFPSLTVARFVPMLSRQMPR
jgi:outer membrane protein TolC